MERDERLTSQPGAVAEATMRGLEEGVTTDANRSERASQRDLERQALLPALV